jgi:hypothetical protein
MTKVKNKTKVKDVMRLFIGGINHGTQLMIPENLETVRTSRIEGNATVVYTYNLKGFVHKDFRCLLMIHDQLSDAEALKYVNKLFLNGATI